MAATTSRKEIIFKEAARLFKEKGYNSSTLRGLADKVGIKGGSIYHHYSSKQEILYHIMEYTMTNLLDGVQLAIDDETGPMEKLRNAITFHIEYHTIDTDETFVTDTELRSLSAENKNKIIQMRNAYEKIYRDILQEGTATDTMRIDNIRTTSRALLQMCTGISYWFNPKGEHSISQIAENYVELFLWGICGKTKTGSL